MDYQKKKKKKNPLEVNNCDNKDEPNIRHINSNAFKISNLDYPKPIINSLKLNQNKTQN